MKITIEKFSKGLLKRNYGNATYQGLPDAELREVLLEYNLVKRTYRKNLGSNLQAYKQGKLGKEEFLLLQRSVINEAYTRSYSLGKRLSNLGSGEIGDTERRSIVYQVSQELSFMEGFADNVMADSGRMPYDRRLDMYSDGLDAVFGFGKLVSMPDEMKIYWRLGRTDKHCPDCISYASNNPYSKRTLPGYPRSGASRCISNCKCRLEYFDKTGNVRYEANRDVKIDGTYQQFLLSMGKSPLNKFIPSSEQFDEVQSMISKYYYERTLSVFDKKYMLPAMKSLKELTRYVFSKNIYFPLNLDISTTLSEVRQFKGRTDFQISLDFILLRKDDIVYIMSGKTGLYGKVKSVISNTVTVKTIENSDTVLKFGKDIAFKYVD